jgi:hypothetical protein
MRQASCKESDCELFAIDSDFERIPGLRLYNRKGVTDA